MSQQYFKNAQDLKEKMRVVQLKRGRIVKFATAGLIALALLLILYQKSGFKLRSESRSNAGLAARLQDLQNQQQQVFHHHLFVIFYCFYGKW